MSTNYSKRTCPEISSLIPDRLADEEFPINIYPAGTMLNHNWKELWEHRELFYFLTLRDIKIKYKQTLLGIAWVLLQPTISTLVFSIIFITLGQNKLMEFPYAVFAFSGFTVWIFIATAISSSSASLISNSNLVTKVYFPRLILPLSAIGASLLDLALGLTSLSIVMTIYSVTPKWTVLIAPLFLILCFVIATSLGVLISAINVRYRDVKYILPVILQLWLFVTPIFYSLEMIPEETRWIWKLNPMTGALNGFRAALFGGSFDPFEIGVSVITAFVLVIFALNVFYRLEESFADVI